MIGCFLNDNSNQPKIANELSIYFIFIYFHFFLMILEMFWSSQFISGLSISYDVTECLVKLHDYWASDIAFSLTLLSQFLEDMEAYAEVSKEKSTGV